MNTLSKREHIKELVREAVVTVSDNAEGNKGGQHTNGPVRGVILEHKEEGFRVFCNGKRSMTENHKLAVTLFELYLEETLSE